MRLEYFEYLVALRDHPSMSAASRSLHVTPQALSIAISRMEEALSVKLVHTNNRGTRLNENGLYLAAKSQELFQAIHAVKAQGEVADGPFVVRVLADEGIKEDFAAALVRRTDEATAPLSLLIDYCGVLDVNERFLKGGYDLALCYRDKFDGSYRQPLSPGLHFIPFWHSPVYVLISRQHPLAAQKTLSLQAISDCGVPLLVDAYGDNYRDVLCMVAPGIQIVFEDNIIAMQKQVMNNLGVSLDYISFDGSMVRGVPEGCAALPLSDDLCGDLGYLMRDDTLPTAGTRVFLDYLLNVIAKKA